MWYSRLSTELDPTAPAAPPADADFAVAVARCADCAAPVSGRFCAACGQETVIETPTVRHFLQEFIDQYVALEGKLGRTLRVLLLRPGQLTIDYVEGRRQRYVRPLKLYLTISVVFFTLLGLLPDASNPLVGTGDEDSAPIVKFDLGDKAHPKPAATAPAPGAAGAAGAKDSAASGKDADDETEAPKPGSLEAQLEQKARGFSKLSREEQNRVLRQKLADDAPYAMFFLLPYFALLLKWFYRRNRQRYGVHLLFSLHLHAFAFMVLMVGFLPLPHVLRQGLQLAMASYLFMALRRVYGGSVRGTLWRMFWLFAFYLLAHSATAASGVLSTLFGGDWA